MILKKKITLAEVRGQEEERRLPAEHPKPQPLMVGWMIPSTGPSIYRSIHPSIHFSSSPSLSVPTMWSRVSQGRHISCTSDMKSIAFLPPDPPPSAPDPSFHPS